MINPIGEIRENIGGSEYALQLNFRDIATLQTQHGETVAGLLNGKAASVEVPQFGPVLDVLVLALKRGSDLSDDEAEAVANHAMAQDSEILGRVLAASFGDQEQGKARSGKARKSKTS